MMIMPVSAQGLAQYPLAFFLGVIVKRNDCKSRDHCWHLGCILPKSAAIIVRTGLDALSTQCGAALVAWGVLTALIIGIELRCQTMPSSWWVARTYGVLWPDDNRDGQFSDTLTVSVGGGGAFPVDGYYVGYTLISHACTGGAKTCHCGDVTSYTLAEDGSHAVLEVDQPGAESKSFFDGTLWWLSFGFLEASERPLLDSLRRERSDVHADAAALC